MHCGIDLDDTASKWPTWFAWLAGALRRDGHKVTIVTLRRDPVAAAAELAALGVPYDALETLPLDRERDVLGWKAERCRALAIDVLFDDAPEIVNRLDASVLGLVVRDPSLGPLSIGDLEGPPLS